MQSICGCHIRKAYLHDNRFLDVERVILQRKHGLGKHGFELFGGSIARVLWHVGVAVFPQNWTFCRLTGCLLRFGCGPGANRWPMVGVEAGKATQGFGDASPRMPLPLWRHALS